MMGMRFKNRAGVLLAIALVIGLAGMASTAARWAGWAQKQDPRYGLPGLYVSGPSGALPPGVPFLPDELGGARLVVEIAFGADLTDTTEASWRWVDVSADVHYDPGIHITIGRQSASQSAPPAECTFELDNRENKYTPFNAYATYWPNVKEGTPIRVRVIISNVSYTRFQGRAIGFNPTPDSTGYHQMITVTAAGVSRVIGQQSNPVQNPTDRAIAQEIGGTRLAGGWSFEQTQISTSAPNVIPNGPPVTFDGVWNGTQKQGPYGSGDLPEWGQGVPQIFTAGANLSNVSNYVAVDVDMRVGSDVPLGTAGQVPSPWAIYTSGTYRRFWFVGNWAAPDQQMMVMGELPNLVQNNLLFTQNAGTYAGWNDGVWHHYRVILQNSAGSLLIQIYVDGVLNNSTTVGSTNLSQVTNVQPFPDIAGTLGHDFEFGHVYVWRDTPPDMYSAFAGHPDETPDARLSRIMSENGYAFNTLGFYDTSALMGPQVAGSLDTIARSCETTEAGWLYDGLTGGTSFMAPSQRYDQFAQFTLDGSKGEVQPDFWPVQDDMARANKVTITNSDNSSSTYEDDTGPNGTAAVGVYTGNAPTNTNYADSTYLDSRARWEVHKGTAFGFRWPTVNVNVRKIPDRAAAIAGMTPGLRFTISPMPVRYQAQYGTDPIELIAEGWSEFLTQFNWEIGFNCSSQDIYDVWKIGDSQFGRIGAGGSTLAGDIAVGASTLSLAMPANLPLWTTAAGDFPMTLLIDGVKVTLTAISGSSSPQTGTIDTTNTPITRFIQSGQAVSPWKNGVIKL